MNLHINFCWRKTIMYKLQAQYSFVNSSVDTELDI